MNHGNDHGNDRKINIALSYSNFEVDLIYFSPLMRNIFC